ncbi:MAG: Trp biosynthesis-associated membrane protein [Naasia sp.]
MPSGRRAKLLALLALVVTAGAVLIGGNLVWFTARVDGGSVEVVGQSAAPALSGLALASLALAGALSLAPVVLRLVLGGLQVALSALVFAAALPALTDPAGRVAPRVTEVTGIDGDGPVRALLLGIDSTPWPMVVLIMAGLGAAAGVWILVTGRSWPVPGRRYAAGTDPEKPRSDAPEERTREDEWDALTRGEDPT